MTNRGKRALGREIANKINQAVYDLIAEDVFEFYACHFRDLEKCLPGIAAEFRPDYDEWARVFRECHRKLGGDFCMIDDIARRLPGNRWVSVMKSVIDELIKSRGPSSDEFSEEERRKFTEDVMRRVLKQDIV